MLFQLPLPAPHRSSLRAITCCPSPGCCTEGYDAQTRPGRGMWRARGYFLARKAVKSELFVRPLKPSLSPRQALGRAPLTIAHRFFFFFVGPGCVAYRHRRWRRWRNSASGETCHHWVMWRRLSGARWDAGLLTTLGSRPWHRWVRKRWNSMRLGCSGNGCEIETVLNEWQRVLGVRVEVSVTDTSM